MKTAASVIAGLALFLFAGRLEATPVLTNNPALVNLPGINLIDFEDLTAPTLITTQYAAEGLTFSGGLHTNTAIPAVLAGSPFGAIAASNGDPGCCPDITLQFGGPTQRMGFDIITQGNAVTTLSVYAVLAGSSTLIGTLSLTAGLEPHFFGVAGDAVNPSATFDSIVISTELNQNPSGFIIDNIRFTDPIPEPSTLTLVGIGATALVRRLRTRRNSQRG